MFKDVPNQLDEGDDRVDITLAEMDKWGVDIGPGRRSATADRAGAAGATPDRFVTSLEVDPNDITGTVRKIRAAQRGARHQGGHDVPGRLQPAGAGDDRRYYPIYQTCIDLDIPIISNAGHRRTAASRRRARTSCTSTRSVTTSPSCAS